MNEASDEADGAVGSTPDTGNPSAAADAQTPESNPATPSQERAPSEDPKPDRDAEVLERLSAGETVASIRQNDKAPVDPSPDKAPQSQQQPGKASSVAQAAEVLDPEADYAGVDPKGLDTLRRAQLLPEPSVWGQMPPTTQKALLASARRVLAAQGRVSQQLGQRRAAPQQATFDPHDDPEPVGEEDDQGTQPADESTLDEPQPRQPARQQGVRAQQPANGRARPGAQTGASLDDALKPVADYLGEDVAAPLRTLFASQNEALARMQQELQQRAVQNEGLARQLFLPYERAGLKEVEQTVGRSLSDKERGDVCRAAVFFFQVQAETGDPITWQEAIERAGPGVLRPDIQQRAQQQLLDRRAASLRSTPARAGSGIAKPNRSLSTEDRDAQAFAMLSQGRSRDEIRAAFS